MTSSGAVLRSARGLIGCRSNRHTRFMNILKGLAEIVQAVGPSVLFRTDRIMAFHQPLFVAIVIW